MIDSKINIILVEDEQIYSRMILFQLSNVIIPKKEIGINHVSSITELEELKEFVEPTIILLDLGLSDSFGKDTFIKTKELFPTSSIIVLTGNNEEQLAAQIMESGAEDFILKTEVNQPYLSRTIRHAVLRKTNAKRSLDSNLIYEFAFQNLPIPAVIYNLQDLSKVDSTDSFKYFENSEEFEKLDKFIETFLSQDVNSAFSEDLFIEREFVHGENKSVLHIKYLKEINCVIFYLNNKIF